MTLGIDGPYVGPGSRDEVWGSAAAPAPDADPVYATYKGTGHIRTFTNQMVDPYHLKVEDIDPVDCIHAISLLNRFTGHCIRPYSVGEHTLGLYMAVPRHLRKTALIHDWSEAYFNDIASPVKKMMPTYKQHEENAQRIIFQKMGVDFKNLEELHDFDKRICANEMLSLFEPPFKHYLPPLPDVYIQKNDRDWRTIRQHLAYLAVKEFDIEPDRFAGWNQSRSAPQIQDREYRERHA